MWISQTSFILIILVQEKFISEILWITFAEFLIVKFLTVRITKNANFIKTFGINISKCLWATSRETLLIKISFPQVRYFSPANRGKFVCNLFEVNSICKSSPYLGEINEKTVCLANHYHNYWSVPLNWQNDNFFCSVDFWPT